MSNPNSIILATEIVIMSATRPIPIGPAETSAVNNSPAIVVENAAIILRIIVKIVGRKITISVAPMRPAIELATSIMPLSGLISILPVVGLTGKVFIAFKSLMVKLVTW